MYMLQDDHQESKQNKHVRHNFILRTFLMIILNIVKCMMLYDRICNASLSPRLEAFCGVGELQKMPSLSLRINVTVFTGAALCRRARACRHLLIRSYLLMLIKLVHVNRGVLM